MKKSRYRLYSDRKARREFFAAVPVFLMAFLLFAALVSSVANSISPLNF